VHATAKQVSLNDYPYGECVPRRTFGRNISKNLCTGLHDWKVQWVLPHALWVHPQAKANHIRRRPAKVANQIWEHQPATLAVLERTQWLGVCRRLEGRRWRRLSTAQAQHRLEQIPLLATWGALSGRLDTYWSQATDWLPIRFTPLDIENAHCTLQGEKMRPTFKSYSSAFHRCGLNNNRLPLCVNATFVNGKRRRWNGVKEVYGHW